MLSSGSETGTILFGLPYGYPSRPPCTIIHFQTQSTGNDAAIGDSDQGSTRTWG